MTEERFPPFVYRRGREPDPRFSLANERTFLAWITAGLAMVSVGVALETLASTLQPAARLVAALLLLGAGLASIVQAWLGWATVEVALREERPLPSPTLMPVIPAVLLLAGACIALGVLTA